MNTYTADPSKTEVNRNHEVPPSNSYAVAGSDAYIPPPTAPNSYQLPPNVSTPMTAPTITSVPTSAYMVPSYPYYPYQQSVAPVIQQDVNKISDWLPWSVVSICLGGVLLGIIPLLFSLACQSKKRQNDLSGARTMSIAALVFNIIITLLGIAAIVFLIVYFLAIHKGINFLYT